MRLGERVTTLLDSEPTPPTSLHHLLSPPVTRKKSPTQMNRVSARNAVSLLPRSLKLSPSTPITQKHIVALYKEQLRVANSFSSYNFKQFFLRKTKDKFRSQLPSILAPSATLVSSSSSALPTPSTSTSSASSSPREVEAAEPESIYAPTGGPQTLLAVSSAAGATPEERLREWYRESLDELAVLARSAVVNRLYEVPRLVVEGKGRVIPQAGDELVKEPSSW